jgi:protein gp37
VLAHVRCIVLNVRFDSAHWVLLRPRGTSGVSAESEQYLSRVDHLRRTQAKVKFLSIEPLLGPLGKLDLAASTG